MRRVPSLVVLIAISALLLPATAAAGNMDEPVIGLAAVIFGLGLIGAAIGAARERAEPLTPGRSPGS